MADTDAVIQRYKGLMTNTVIDTLIQRFLEPAMTFNARQSFLIDPDILETYGEGLYTEDEVLIAGHVREILKCLGQDPMSDGLRNTPTRVAKMWSRELLGGYTEDVKSLFTTFEDDSYDAMVLLKDIPFASTCEHHMVPFTGIAHIGYLPKGRVIGLSKLARLLEVYTRRLQTQERITVQVANALMDHLQPRGAMVVLEAEHMCMTIRGVRKSGQTMVTSAVRGVFEDPGEGTREEFLRLIGK